MHEDLRDLREQVALANRALFAAGHLDVRGHVSARVPGTGHLLIPVHLHTDHRLASQVTPDDIIEVDELGQSLDIGREPPNEVFIHSSIYAVRPDVAGIAHVHPEAATAISCTASTLKPISQYALAMGVVPIFRDPWSVSNAPRGDALATALGPHAAVLMQGHGATVVGSTVEEAAARSDLLERASRVQLMAETYGDVVLLSLDNGDAHGRWMNAVTLELLPSIWQLLVSRTPV